MECVSSIHMGAAISNFALKDGKDHSLPGVPNHFHMRHVAFIYACDALLVELPRLTEISVTRGFRAHG